MPTRHPRSAPRRGPAAWPAWPSTAHRRSRLVRWRQALDGAGEGAVVEEAFENSRYMPTLGWGSSFPGHMLPTDRRHWSRIDGSNSKDNLHDLVYLPPGWAWHGPWRTDLRGVADGCIDAEARPLPSSSLSPSFLVPVPFLPRPCPLPSSCLSPSFLVPVPFLPRACPLPSSCLSRPRILTEPACWGAAWCCLAGVVLRCGLSFSQVSTARRRRPADAAALCAAPQAGAPLRTDTRASAPAWGLA